MNGFVYERWMPTCYEYRAPSEVVRERDIETPARKGSRAAGKSAKAPRKNGGKAPRDMAGAAQA